MTSTRLETPSFYAHDWVIPKAQVFAKKRPDRITLPENLGEYWNLGFSPEAFPILE